MSSKRAGLIACVCVTWVIGPAWSQTSATVAQLRYEEGLGLYDEGDYTAALDSFNASMTVLASPNSRLFVARCLRQLERYAEALNEYNLTVREATERSGRDPRYGETARAAEQERSELMSRVGWIVLSFDDPPPDLLITINGREFPPQAADLELPVDPGAIEIRAEASGYEPYSTHLEVAAEGRERVALDLRPLPQQEPARRTTAEAPPRSRRRALLSGTLVSAGLTLAASAVFAALWVMANQQYDQLLDECGGTCPPDRDEDIDRGVNLEIGTNVMLGLGIGAASSTLLNGLLMIPERRRAAERAAGATAGLDRGDLLW